MTAHRRPLIALAAFGAVLLASCSSMPPLQIPASLPLPEKQKADAQDTTTQHDNTARRLTQTTTPSIDDVGPSTAGSQLQEALPAMSSAPVSVNVQNVPVPVFANEVFGNMLGLNMTMSPAVSKLQELVTLRTESRQKPRDLFEITRQLLAEYGVEVTVEGKLVKLDIAPKGASLTPPLIISGRALPQVPVSHRPIFQLIELDVVRSGDAVQWLNTLFGRDIKVLDESSRNSIIINGKPAQVQQAVDALRVFDRPLMRGKVSTRLEPAFMSAEQLTDRLVDVLNVQGYGANRTVGSPSSVIVLPITAANSVLIFASTQKALDYAVSWARELDRPNKQAGAQSLFYYQVKNTKAEDIAKVLSGGHIGATPAASKQTSQTNNNTPVSSSLQVDTPRNALIFQGDPVQWERMLALIKKMDKAPRQVMVEVTIAEVTLNDDSSFGLSWFAKNGFGRFDGSTWMGKGSGGDSLGESASNGLTFLLDIAGQNRAALTAFANDNRVSILSTPRLLVKSGSQASFDVGTEVPTVTMSTTSNQQSEGSSNLLQSIQYRKTGVILQIEPTVYSDDRIDLDITQEVSEAMPLGDNATANSPSIFNRAITTSLSLRDGGSVVLGGLMSSRQTDTDSGVPFLKDVPVLGNLFKSKSKKKNKTELVIIIVPYIIENDEHATAVSRAIIDQAELLDLNKQQPHASTTASPSTAQP